MTDFRIERDNLINISDDGIGFDPEQVVSLERSERGVGLASMRERTELTGGHFFISSGRQTGTTIRIVWSLALCTPLRSASVFVAPPEIVRPRRSRPSLLFAAQIAIDDLLRDAGAQVRPAFERGFDGHAQLFVRGVF
jgi:hypothetical protein